MVEIAFAFLFVFLAAVPGRTTFILVMLGSYERPARLLAAALPAFVVQCLIAVLVGQAVKQVPHGFVNGAAGILFLYFALKYWRESKQPEGETPPGRSWVSIFTLFFLAELGDVSQLAVAARATQSDSPLSVFLGASLAMICLAVIAVFAGRNLKRFLSPRLVKKGAAAVFGLLGAYLIGKSVL